MLSGSVYQDKTELIEFQLIGCVTSPPNAAYLKSAPRAAVLAGGARVAVESSAVSVTSVSENLCYMEGELRHRRAPQAHPRQACIRVVKKLQAGI
jgi:hypothetical protein